MYLNTVYYGHNYYGIYRSYSWLLWNKSKPIDIRNQSALLAALPNAPSYWIHIQTIKGAKARQKLVLEQMVDQGMITQARNQIMHTNKIWVLWMNNEYIL